MRSAKHIIFLVGCMLFSMAYSQGNTNITRAFKEFHVFQIGVVASPNICYRTLENKERATSIDELIGMRNGSETIKWGYHVGLDFQLNVSKHFGMSLGVVYCNRGYETQLTDFIYPQPDPSLPIKGRSIYNFNYIDIPLKANFLIGRRSVKFYASFGVITSALLFENQTLMRKFEDGHKEYESFPTNFNYQNVVFSGTVSAGLDIKTGKFMNLRFAPYFTHNIGRVIDEPLSTYLWTTGIQVGYYFGL